MPGECVSLGLRTTFSFIASDSAVRFQPGILCCLLAGCAMQPTPVRSLATADVSSRDLFQKLADANSMRLGVEFLPPAEDERAVAVRPSAARVNNVPVEPRSARPKTPYVFDSARRERKGSDRHTWVLSSDDLAALRTPVERETLHFLDDVLEQDHNRSVYDLGTPILDVETIDLQSPESRLPDYSPDVEERAEQLNQRGFGLLRSPSRRLFRRLPVVHDLEVQVETFSSVNVPLSRSYREAHEDQRKLGRLTVRVRANDLVDPVELNYFRSGVRLGSSQSTLKLGFQREIVDSVTLDVQTQYDYETYRWNLRADLGWAVTPHSSLHLLASDAVDFLVTSNQHSLYETPLDGSPGLLLYAVHRF